MIAGPMITYGDLHGSDPMDADIEVVENGYVVHIHTSESFSENMNLTLPQRQLNAQVTSDMVGRDVSAEDMATFEPKVPVTRTHIATTFEELVQILSTHLPSPKARSRAEPNAGDEKKSPSLVSVPSLPADLK